MALSDRCAWQSPTRVRRETGARRQRRSRVGVTLGSNGLPAAGTPQGPMTTAALQRHGAHSIVLNILGHGLRLDRLVRVSLLYSQSMGLRVVALPLQVLLDGIMSLHARRFASSRCLSASLARPLVGPGTVPTVRYHVPRWAVVSSSQVQAVFWGAYVNLQPSARPRQHVAHALPASVDGNVSHQNASVCKQLCSARAATADRSTPRVLITGSTKAQLVSREAWVPVASRLQMHNRDQADLCLPHRRKEVSRSCENSERVFVCRRAGPPVSVLENDETASQQVFWCHSPLASEARDGNRGHARHALCVRAHVQRRGGCTCHKASCDRKLSEQRGSREGERVAAHTGDCVATICTRRNTLGARCTRHSLHVSPALAMAELHCGHRRTWLPPACGTSAQLLPRCASLSRHL
jgi:hypothetical protein